MGDDDGYGDDDCAADGGRRTIDIPMRNAMVGGMQIVLDGDMGFSLWVCDATTLTLSLTVVNTTATTNTIIIITTTTATTHVHVACIRGRE